MPYPGEIIAGTYQIREQIGKGGAGIIYRAYHLNLHKDVVVKKIKDNYVGVLNARGEVDILKSLHHTYLPQVYDFIQMGSEIYTVMDHIEGHDLQYYIDQNCFFEEQSLWYWLGQLLEVLAYLHGNGILHLDIKPANIMLTAQGNICLIDFNISFDGEGDGMTGISRTYASPEQYGKWMDTLYGNGGRDIFLDARTDIYSLGAAFYHMMTGCPPSPVPSEMMPIQAFRLSYSDDLVSFISKMLRPDPGKRFSSAGKALQAYQGRQRTKQEKSTLRRVFVVMLGAVAVLAIVIGIVLFRSHGYVSRKDREEIARQEERLAELNSNGEYEAAYREGAGFLNVNGETADKLKGARQSIEAQLLDACMGMEDYDLAAYYVERLLDLDVKGEYYEKAAVVSAYRGELDTAEVYLLEAENRGCSSEELEISRAEICAARGDYEGAIRLYESLYESERQTDILRKLAALYRKASEVSEKDKAFCLSRAVSCYETLDKGNMAACVDRLNLLTAYMEIGMDTKAESLARSMRVDYPDKYQPCMYLAIICYEEQLRCAVSNRDYSEVKKYAQEAKKRHETNGAGNGDRKLEELLNIVDSLP